MSAGRQGRPAKPPLALRYTRTLLTRFGVDTPTHGELIANNLDIEAIRQYIQADSLSYLSHEGLYSFLDPEERSSKGFCDACFTRSYPVAVNHDQEARQMRLFHAMEMQRASGG